MDLTATPVGDIPVSELEKWAQDSEREFTQDMAQPPKPAIGTEPPPQAGAHAHVDFDFSTPAPEAATEEKEFFKEDTGSPKTVMAGMSIDAMLKLRFGFEALLFKEVAMEGEAEDYMPTDFEMELYREVYAPYRDMAAEKIPPGIWILMVEVIITGKRFMHVLKLRKVNIANKKAAKVDTVNPGGTMVQSVSKTVPFSPAAPKGLRTNFKIFADGTYHFCRETDSQKAVYKKQGSQPIEKVDLGNIDHVKQVIHANGWEKLQRAFLLPDNWPQSKGIDIENLGLEEE